MLGLHSPACSAGPVQPCVYCRDYYAQWIVRGLYSPVYSTLGPLNPCEYCWAYKALRIVLGLFSPEYSAGPVQLCGIKKALCSPAYNAGPGAWESPPCSAGLTKSWVYFRDYTALCIVQGLYSPAYSGATIQSSVYCRGCTALCTVQGLYSPVYSAGPAKPCE